MSGAALVKTAREEAVVSPSRLVVRLIAALVAVVAVAAAVGLFTAGGPGPHELLTPRGQSVEVYGTGLYRHDSWLVGAGNRATDAVTLFLELPLLILASRAYRRGSVRAAVVVVGVLGWLLYYYASMSLYTAFNRAFPLYVVALALALVAAPLAMRSIDARRFAAAFPRRPSPRLLIGYLIAVAVALCLAWVPAMVGAAVSGGTPARLDVYSTEVTWTLDLAFVVPAAMVTALLLGRGAAFGPLAATAMLALNVFLGCALVGQGVGQLVAGVPLAAGEVLGAMVSFAVLTAAAAALLLPLLRRLPDAPDTGPGRALAP